MTHMRHWPPSGDALDAGLIPYQLADFIHDDTGQRGSFLAAVQSLGTL